MLNLSLKQAETALAKGQLDEAYALVRSPRVGSSRSAQELAARLVSALVRRGNDHLAAGRLAAAASDAAKALEVGGQQVEVAELFAAVQSARASQRQRVEQEQVLLRQARRQVDRGAATMGRQLLGHADADLSEVQHLQRQLEVRKELNQATLLRATAAIEAGQHAKALDLLIGVSQDQPDHAELGSEIVRAVAPILSQVWDDLGRGRLDRALSWQPRLQQVASESTEVDELVDVMRRCRRVRAQLDRSQYTQAQNELGRLAQMLPETSWIGEALTALGEIVLKRSQLDCGPIGLVDNQLATELPDSPVLPDTLRRGPALADEHEPRPASSNSLPKRMLLQVDGTNRVLLLQSDTVTIGSASASASVDIPLRTDGVQGSIKIHRHGDDYLLTSDAPCEVDGRQDTRRLLTSGDVISVGRRGRLKFQKPIAASATALLEITGASLPNADIRRIVLFADALILGNGAGVHLPVRGLAARYALYPAGDALAIGKVGGGGQKSRVPLAQTVTLDDVRLQVKDYESDRSVGGRSDYGGGRRS